MTKKVESDFDPYLRWLGIRDKERPPNHYRLLGLELFENDTDIIATAADRQMTHVRTYQSGRHALMSQKLLNELAAARVCLLDAAKKASYDGRLRATQSISSAPAPGGSGVLDAEPVADGSSTVHGGSGSAVASLKPLPVAKPLTSRPAAPNTAPPQPAAPGPVQAIPVAKVINSMNQGRQSAAAAPPPAKPTAPAATPVSSGGAGNLTSQPIIWIAAASAAFVLLLALAIGIAWLSSRGRNNVPPNQDLAVGPDRPSSPHMRPPIPRPTPPRRPINDRDISPPRRPPLTDDRTGNGAPPKTGNTIDPPTPPAPPTGPAPWELPSETVGSVSRQAPNYSLSPDVHGRLQQARDAMRDRNMNDARRFISMARGYAKSSEERSEIDRLFRCSMSLDEFWRAVQFGLLRAREGGEITYRDVPVTVTRRDPTRITLKAPTGQSISLPTGRDQISRDLAMALAGNYYRASDSRRTPAFAAFEAFDRDGRVANVASLCSKSSASGSSINALMAEAMFDFKLAKVASPTPEVPPRHDLSDLVGGPRTSERPIGSRLPEEARPSEDESAGVAKRSPPEKDDLESSIEEIEELFADQYRSRDPRQKVALARDLLRQAKETDEDVSRYALLDQASKIAASLGDVQTSLKAMAQLVEEYDVMAAEAASDVVDNLARRTLSKQDAETLVSFALNVGWAGIMQDDFRHAAMVLGDAQSALKHTHSPELAKFVRTAKDEMAYLKRQYDKVELARKKLEESPDDPQANLTIARYLCLAKGKFADALPHFEKGEGGELAELAQLEADQPTDSDEQARLANGWWDMAEEELDPVKRWTRLRAANWYRKALPSLRGLKKTQAEKRLKEAESLADDAGMLRWGRSLEQMIVGQWQVIWRYAPTYSSSTSTRSEMITFDADKTFDGYYSGTWTVQGSDVIATHGSYIDRYRMVAPNQIIAGRIWSGRPYQQGMGQRIGANP
jgi:hypothetical protein